MVEFRPARNGELTATKNALPLHSSYNPSQEAVRFAEPLCIADYENTVIFIEPCISYVVPLVKQKYPQKKIGIIRFSGEFSQFNTNADFVINFYEYDFDVQGLAQKLLGLLGEERLFESHFLSWNPSKKAFEKEYENAARAIKLSLENARTMLVTREYFEKVWLKNTFSFIKNIRNPLALKEKINKKILILASGPSLQDAIPVIKKYQDAFFIICLSSAVSVCLHNQIKIDLCMSTDGGFWAGEHLKHLPQNIPLALAVEGKCSKKILQDNPVLPLSYDDGLSKTVIDKVHFDTVIARRNGTVSGTAVEFALAYSNEKVYFCGLDLQNAKGFQHTQPNELEKNSSLGDFRLSPAEKRIYKSEISNGSLGIYRTWFENAKFEKGRIFRIIGSQQNSLGAIADITASDFEELCKNMNPVPEKSPLASDNFFEKRALNKSPEKLKQVIGNIITKENDDKIFPLTSLSLRHNLENVELKNHLEDEKNQLIKKLERICDE